MSRLAFAKALRKIRKARGLRQEDFSDQSSRTYLSVLERGKKSPTLEKIQELARVLEVHMLTLLTLTAIYSESGTDVDSLLRQVKQELEKVAESEK
jgi:transcriptional regulator with XRE-family HTH domain